LALFERLLSARVDRIVMQASENLHTSYRSPFVRCRVEQTKAVPVAAAAVAVTGRDVRRVAAGKVSSYLTHSSTLNLARSSAVRLHVRCHSFLVM
jgi:hypothetical protein